MKSLLGTRWTLGPTTWVVRIENPAIVWLEKERGPGSSRWEIKFNLRENYQLCQQEAKAQPAQGWRVKRKKK